MTNDLRHQTKYFTLILIAVILAIIMNALPWLTNPGAGLCFGAGDLAEWASLHPAVRAASPPLLTSFLLRLPLVCLALITGFSAPPPILKSRAWWIAAMVSGVILVLLFPPLEYFTIAQNDKNYQQQIMLVGTALVGCGLGLSRILASWRGRAVILWAITGAGSGLVGLQKSYDLMRNFDLPVQIGIGGIGLPGAFILIAVISWLYNTKRGDAPV